MISFLTNNQVTLLQNGEAYFPAIEAAFDRARYAIYLETYIFNHDETGRRIAEALKRAAHRGVSTHVLVDGFGSKDLPRAVIDDLRAAGVKVLRYRPRISPWSLRRNRLRRLHRKLVVVDREIAFVGGINIIDDMVAGRQALPRYDYAVAVIGPLVEVIRRAARHLWSLVAWTNFRTPLIRNRGLPEPLAIGGRMRAGFLVRDNLRHRRAIEDAYLQAIAEAKSEVVIANAYFLPGIHFRHALIKAAQRGVRVILLLQGRVEYVLQHYASRALYGSLLDAGIEIFEYRKGFMHAKVAVIDGYWATVGSSNIDPFSLLLSREANVVVEDREFAGTLLTSLTKALETDARPILKDNWKQQPVTLRIMSWFCYGMVRLLMGIAGNAHENYYMVENRVLPAVDEE